MNLKEFPKVELHLHLDGSVKPETLADILKLDLRTIKKEMIAKAKCKDLNEYLTKFLLPIKIMQTEDILTRVTKELIEDLNKENVIYAEIRFAPLKHILKQLSLNQVVEAVLNGFDQKKVKTNLILCMMRDASFEENKQVIDLAYNYLNKGVVAIDLAGAEGLYKTENFRQLFAYAKEKNIPFTIHAGEADGISSIESAISFGTKRIGHGIRCIQDKKTIDKLIKKNILLEICPTSNIQTNVVNNYKNHPIKKLYDLGCKISVNTDNRTVSNVNLTEEYSHLIDDLHFTPNDLIKINKNAIEAAFLSKKEKENLFNKMDKYL